MSLGFSTSLALFRPLIFVLWIEQNHSHGHPHQMVLIFYKPNEDLKLFMSTKNQMYNTLTQH